MSSLPTFEKEVIFGEGKERVLLETWELGTGQIGQEYKT